MTRWLPGETALVSPPVDEAAAAADLARFLRALHRPAPPDAPRNSWRGVPLDARDALLREHLAALAGRVDHAAVVETWDRLRVTARWKGAAVWIHGDLHPGNLLVRDGRLSGYLISVISAQAIRQQTCPSRGCCCEAPRDQGSLT